MENILSTLLQEVIFGSSDSTISKQISRLEKAGKIRKIAPRLYTSNLTETPESIVRRNLFTILGKLYPGAVLSHRSALEFKPSPAGYIFLTYKYTKKGSLPGITIRFMEGPDPIEGDNPISEGLFASQRERAILENLQISRRPGPESKTLTLPEIEERMELIIRVNGEEELKNVRDRAREIARQLNMQNEFNKLQKIISALLSTHPSKILFSPLAQARAFGIPFDPTRLELFEKLFQELQQQEFKSRLDKNTSLKAFRNFAFFESYFSNYIEGTVFEIDEAKEIVTSNTPIPSRKEDSHDILGTYQIVSSIDEMKRVPISPDELLNILQYRHEILLSARPEKNPGKFKESNNRSGETHFVDFKLVRGTLIKSFNYYQVLQQPFAKAAYIMFVISEIHPFADGNGKIARIMMNAELVIQGEAKIIIPTVCREDHLLALRRLTRQYNTGPYIHMLLRAHEFSTSVFDEDMDQMQEFLISCNAFLEHSEGSLKILSRD